MLVVQTEFLKTTLKVLVKVMANVDHSSSVLLSENEKIVDFAIDHCPAASVRKPAFRAIF